MKLECQTCMFLPSNFTYNDCNVVASWEKPNWEPTVHLYNVQTKYSAHPWYPYTFFYPCHLRNPNLPLKNSNMGPTFSRCVSHRTRTLELSGNDCIFIPRRSVGSILMQDTYWKVGPVGIWIFRRQIWIPGIKMYMDNLGVRNTSSEPTMTHQRSE